jgi:hypothetical protein
MIVDDLTADQVDTAAQNARELRQRIRELEAALHPFAAFAYAATAYGLLHRGSFPSDSKSVAYVQTETGDAGNITWGDLKLAGRVMPRARHGGESADVRWARVQSGKTRARGSAVAEDGQPLSHGGRG